MYNRGRAMMALIVLQRVYIDVSSRDACVIRDYNYLAPCTMNRRLGREERTVSMLSYHSKIDDAYSEKASGGCP